jgi:hypothetical protein
VSRKVVLGGDLSRGRGGIGLPDVILIHGGLAAAGLRAAVVGALAGVLAAAGALWAVARKGSAGLPPELRVPDWTIDRPAELSAVVRALVGSQAGMVGITTGLYGRAASGRRR